MNTDSVLLNDKVAIVTGGGAGIGRGIAKAFAAFGAQVALFERDPQRALRVAQEIETAGGNVLGLAVDVRDAQAVESAVEKTVNHFGDIDILVNNAGGVFAEPFMDSNEKGWDALHSANLKHIYHCSQSAARRMIEQGRGGSLINIVSVEGARAAPLYATYAAAKAGAINFTKTLALELAPHSIRVNAIAPDICLTEGLRIMMDDAAQEHACHTVPLGRLGEPDDIGGVAVFLAGEMSSYITGQTLHVDGGTQAAGGWYHHPEGGHYVYGPLSEE
ncbi:MAG: SDR family NAD(P)-dependent oxidoreductase [Halioglobus sp.]|nr:SDR family NAD(P)-dependent oxidoreductase [Halioglobus sp.]